MRRLACFLLVSFAIANFLPAAVAPGNEWMLLLSDPPVVQRYPGRIEQTRAVSAVYRQHLRDVQTNLRAQIEAQSITVTGAVQHLLNGIFVIATPAQAAALRNLPGVEGVVPMRRVHLADQLSLSDVQQAWSSAAIGGAGNAGAGMKIGIIDTGIDQTHPSFQDSSLVLPAGFPKCDTYTLGTTTQSDCAFTTNKVIVARSYVSTITPGARPSGSRPDDNSARDLVGHGTAVASVVAGVASSYFTNSLSGVAPKAFLGNYKIYGSAEIGGASGTGILEALDDAVTDGMDVVNFSSGEPAFESPTDTGAVCGVAAGQPCDPLAAAFENAMKNGQVIAVVAAGNYGASGYQAPNGIATYGSIASPAYTPSVIAAGGVQNDITYADTIDVIGSNVPSNLQTLIAFPAADSTTLSSPLSAPIVDVTQLGDDPLLCTAPAAGSLTGEVALIFRGTCDFSVKVPNAQAAGARGVIIIDNNADPNSLIGWGGLMGATIPALMISQSDGQNLQTFIDSSPGTKVTLNTEEAQVPATSLGIVPESAANFASRGPSVGNYGLKPDLAATATNFLLAAENVDPFGELFSSQRYAVADGTSFASPMVAGAAALVKQAMPSLTPLQVKSALVNSATLSGILNQAGTGPAFIADVGSGMLQAQNAVIPPVEFNPSTISFGSAAGGLPPSQTITITNSSGAPITLTFTVSATTPAPATHVVINGSSTASAAVPVGGASVNVSLSGTVPPAGRYEGVISAAGAAVPLHIPYMFVVPSNTAYDVIPLEGGGFDGPINQEIPAAYGSLLLRVIDQFGTSVANAPVQWATASGGGRIIESNSTTDGNGLAGALATLGPTVGSQSFSATVAGMTVPFTGNGRNVPAISAGGIVDGAAFTANRAVAPGSIISIFGVNLSDVSAGATQFPLPLGIDGVAFSFDVPSANVSLPARFHYVSPGQINVQVPWELANYPSATVKVIINYTYSATYVLNLATYSPGFFAYQANGQAYASALDSTLAVVTANHPVARGTTVALYMNGLGPVNNQPADGWPATDATSTTMANPTITIGGQTATVTFSGLAPEFADLYQVNATVPTSIGAGAQPVTCTIGGVSCQTVYLYVN
jgi:uncharacterized protein (TIGR03437 family)